MEKNNINNIIEIINASQGEGPRIRPYSINIINPFQSRAALPHPLKTSENKKFSDVFRGYSNATLG